MGLIFKDESSASTPKTARVWSVVFSLIIGFFVLVALLALLLLAHDEIVSQFRMPRKFAMGLLSAAIVSGGLVLLMIGIKQKKDAIRAIAAKSESNEKPWLKRPEWISGRITSSLRKPILLLWIIVLFWCGASLVILSLIILSQLQTNNHALLISAASIVMLIIIAALVFAWWTTAAWRQFRQSIFITAATPVAAGGALQGQIQVPGKVLPSHGWHLALSCVQRKTSGPTNNLRTTEKTLWRDEKWLRCDLLQKNAAGVTLPVFFQVPADKPDSTPEKGDGIHWKLEAWAQLAGPNFEATFEVPVFKLPEPAGTSDDPTLPYQISLDEIRKQIHSKIQVDVLPTGQEFIFPSGRTPGFAMGATIICLVWTGIVALLILKHAPPLLPLVFGAIDLLMLYFVGDLWLRRSHIAIADDAIKIETAWASFRQHHSLKISEAAGFFAEAGTPVGHSTYYDLKLRMRDGKEWLLAKNLGHKPEADWLARQMTAAAKSAPAKSV